MTKKQALIKEIKEAAKLLNIDPNSFDIHTSTSKRDFPITVMGEEWKHLPMGMTSENTNLIAGYLRNIGWKMVDADRSGTYLEKDSITIRFC